MSPPVVVLAGGGDAAPQRPLPPDATVIAADSGLHLAESLGLSVAVVVGDFDSARPETVARAVAGGSRVEKHDPDKDAKPYMQTVEIELEGNERMLLDALVKAKAQDFLPGRG